MDGRLKRIYRTIIAATMLVFVVAGIMQFHHHHNCEHAHSLCSFLLEEIAHCGHSHSDMPAHPDSPDSDCAMHLSDFHPSGDDDSSLHSPACHDGHDGGGDCHHRGCPLPHAERCRHFAAAAMPLPDCSRRPGPHPCEGYPPALSLRGPPFC